MKAWFAIAAVMLSTSALAQKQMPIDLDAPGALEALARTNPAHFAKVQRILEEAPHMPSSTVAKWILTEFKARDFTQSRLIMTSYPAQADISFVLDDTAYRTRIRIDAPPRTVPAQKK